MRVVFYFWVSDDGTIMQFIITVAMRKIHVFGGKREKVDNETERCVSLNQSPVCVFVFVLVKENDIG